MILKAYYPNDVVKTIEVDNTKVFLYNEAGHVNRLVRKNHVEIKNAFPSQIGAVLDKLLPMDNNIASMIKFEVYEGEVLIKQFNSILNPFYRLYTPSTKEAGTDVFNPGLIEIIDFEV